MPVHSVLSVFCCLGGMPGLLQFTRVNLVFYLGSLQSYCAEFDALLHCAASMSASDLTVARFIASSLLRCWPKGDTVKEVKLLKFIADNCKWALLDAEKELLATPKSGRSTPLSLPSVHSLSRLSEGCPSPQTHVLAGSDSDTPSTPRSLARRYTCCLCLCMWLGWA